MKVGDTFRIDRFTPAMQCQFRQLVLDGPRERFGTLDESLNTDLDDVASFYRNDIVLVAFVGEQLIGTGIVVLRQPTGKIIRMSVHQNHRR